ncbi:hypothetical protein FXO37_30239 [Capsicum annuum]|nr:hypothetical protein FXO37_30239 [Capsicum annuum]
MEDSPSFSLGLTQLDTNLIVGFVPEVFDYEEPNFDENISKFRNDPNKMKEIRKTATKKSKKIVGKSSRLSKKDDSGHPRLPKVVGIKVKYRKFMASMFSKSQVNLDIQGFEEFSTVPSTTILKKTGLITDASTSHPTKKRKTVCFDSTAAEEQAPERRKGIVIDDMLRGDEIVIIGNLKHGSEIIATKHSRPQKWRPKNLKVIEYTSEEEGTSLIFEKISRFSSLVRRVIIAPSHWNWTIGKLHGGATRSYRVATLFETWKFGATHHYHGAILEIDNFHLSYLCDALKAQDVEGCSENNVTASLDALVESVVNHNSDNTNVGTSTTVHVHNDHMDVERASADIRPATLECLVAAMDNLKPDNAPVDDVPIEVIPPSEPVVNQHNISNSQLPLDFPDVIVTAHQAAKTPAKIAKRIRTRSKVFKSPYRTEYASGSKAIEDQIEE